MKKTLQKYAKIKYCIDCTAILKVEENWHLCNVNRGRYLCNSCVQKRNRDWSHAHYVRKPRATPEYVIKKGMTIKTELTQEELISIKQKAANAILKKFLKSTKNDNETRGETRRCSSCRLFFSISEFYKDHTRRDGLRPECKSCRRKNTLTKRTKWDALSALPTDIKMKEKKLK